jgi:transposase-like protein
MILSAIAEKLKRRSKDDFKGRHFEASLILQAVSWYLRYALSYRDIEELFLERGLCRSTTSPRACTAKRGHLWPDADRPAVGTAPADMRDQREQMW